MSTHLYCVLPPHVHGAIPPGLVGVEGGHVRAIPVDGIVAWVSDVARSSVAAFPRLVAERELVDGVRAHDAVVEAALDTGSTPVPARFGQRFDNDEACRAALASRGPAVATLLETMQGLVEMTVLVTPSTGRMLRDLEPVLPEMFDPETGGVGRRYLETLRRREATTGAVARFADDLADRLTGAVSPFVRRSMVHQSVTRMPLRTISHLIARVDVDGYREAIAGIEGGRERRVLLIGPRAPYSFSALNDGNSGAHGMNLAG